MRPTSYVFMHYDIQITVTKAKSKIFNEKNKHILLRYNIMRKMLQTRIISLEFVRSKLNLVKSLTKPLNRKLMEETSRRMWLMPNTKFKSDCKPTYLNRDPMK